MPADQPTRQPVGTGGEGVEGPGEELRDALDQQAATAQILRVISESPGNLQPVLDAIAKSANRLCDGMFMMIFFNDPVLVPNPGERAVRMALAMRERVAEMIAGWRRRGYELDLGIGIAQGYATIGAIGFEGRWDYGAIGTVTNLAARLCGEAKPGQILLSRRLLGTVDELIQVEPVGDLALKGFLKPVPAFNLVGLK